MRRPRHDRHDDGMHRDVDETGEQSDRELPLQQIDVLDHVSLHPHRARRRCARDLYQILGCDYSCGDSREEWRMGMALSVYRSIVVVSIALAGQALPALAQQPTEQPIAAIRSSCRSDFLSHCSGVPRGGAEAFACLRQNLAKLSAGCQTAVSAAIPKTTAPAPAPVAAPAAPPPTAPAAAAAPAAPVATAPAPATAPSPAPVTARPTTPSAAAPSTPPAAVPAAPKPRVASPSPAAARPAPQPAPQTAPQPAALGPIPPLPLRVRMQILRACGPEQRTFCANVPAGQGRIVECLAANGTWLSPQCRQAIVTATR